MKPSGVEMKPEPEPWPEPWRCGPRPGCGGAISAWKLTWLTPARCRTIFAALVVFSFLSQWRFLTHDCPVDLSGDEAQYWDWSRNLDLSYYSKGPLIAYLIRGSCWAFGH